MRKLSRKTLDASRAQHDQNHTVPCGKYQVEHCRKRSSLTPHTMFCCLIMLGWSIVVLSACFQSKRNAAIPKSNYSRQLETRIILLECAESTLLDRDMTEPVETLESMMESSYE